MEFYQTFIKRLGKVFGYEYVEEETIESAEKRLLTAAEEGDVTSLVSLLQTDCSVNAFNSQVRKSLELIKSRNYMQPWRLDSLSFSG